MTEILIIDDHLGPFKPGLQHALRGYVLRFALKGSEGLEQLEHHPDIALVLLDINMPAEFADDEMREGIEVLKQIKAKYADLPVIMLTVLTDIDLVVEAIQEGAFHYITKPIDRDKLRETVRRATENRELKQQVHSMNRARDALFRVHSTAPTKRTQFCGMLGGHPLMQELYARIERAALFEDMNVVLLGESGSGKDLAARAIHASSPRAKKPFLAVNCAAIAESVLESELFGHEKGAFTGADEARPGLFRQADGGTFFLDEIGAMSPALQTKLLRAIESHEVTPVGGTPVTVDVRIVCATNQDLVAAKEEGKFRPDLYYRIWDIPLTLPPLRSRKEDLPMLVGHFLEDCARRNRLSCTLGPGALDALQEHDWPGNIRELAAVVRRMAVFAEGGHITEDLVRCTLGLPCAPAATEEKARVRETTGPSEAEAASAPAPATEDATGGLPAIEDIAEYRRVHGEIKLKAVLQRAIEEGGSARAAMALLAMPEERYDAFRKWLQRLGIKVRKAKEVKG